MPAPSCEHSLEWLSANLFAVAPLDSEKTFADVPAQTVCGYSGDFSSSSRRLSRRLWELHDALCEVFWDDKTSIFQLKSLEAETSPLHPQAAQLTWLQRVGDAAEDKWDLQVVLLLAGHPTRILFQARQQLQEYNALREAADMHARDVVQRFPTL